MKLISETKALELLGEIREEFAARVRDGFEHRAKPCSACETPGACCRDEHFVNVRVSRLEAAAMNRALSELPETQRTSVRERTTTAIKRLGLHDGQGEKYACPLYEKGVGCLVHEAAKPLPCIAHACYERKEDLPPDELLDEREAGIDRLNRRVYGKSAALLPIPVALSRLLDLPAYNRNRDQQAEEDQVIPERQVVPRVRLDHDPEQKQQYAEDQRRTAILTRDECR